MDKLSIIVVLIYITVFNLIYAYLVSPIFSYSGLVFEPDISKFIFAQLTTLLLITVFKKKNISSAHLIYLLFVNLYIPFINFYWMANKSNAFAVMIFISFLILFLVFRVVRPIKLEKLPIDIKIKIEAPIFILTVLVLLLFIMKFGGIDSRSFDFTTVYEIRNEQQYTGIWSYLFNWLSKLLIPFLIVVFYYKGKYTLLLTVIFMQTFLYLSTGSKTILFSSFIILISCILIKKRKFFIGIPLLYSLIMVASSLIYVIFRSINLLSIFPIRQLVIPAQISFQHYDFFSVNEKLYLREGLFGKIIGESSPYLRPSTKLVGDGRSNANTNFLTDAFDNGGFIFMIIFLMCFILVLIYIDSISYYWNNHGMITSLFIYTIIILNDGALLTTILTWGLGILLILILLIEPNTGGKKIDKHRKIFK